MSLNSILFKILLSSPIDILDENKNLVIAEFEFSEPRKLNTNNGEIVTRRIGQANLMIAQKLCPTGEYLKDYLKFLQAQNIIRIKPNNVKKYFKCVVNNDKEKLNAQRTENPEGPEAA